MNILKNVITATCLTCVMSASALADSDIYLTNNSNQTMSIQVNHTGSDLLEEGSEWKQYVQTLKPWETKMVLSFNRWKGVKSGDTYQFETLVTNENGESLSLLQQVKGYWYKSTLDHGASANDVALKWADDRDTYRYQSQYNSNSKSTEIAFKASATGRYDDIYYSITPQKIDEQPVADADTLKVMSYNVWALPVIAKHIGDRFQEIPKHLKGYDVLMLQEVFASGRDAFLRDLAKEYPYQTKMLDSPGINVYDGGVTIVSRYPIVNEGQYVYPDCSGTDCFADKGVNYAEVIKNGQAYHVLATHTASFDTDTAREYRQRQFRQMRNFAQAQNIPATDTVVYGGDFNVNKLKFPTDYHQMFVNLSADEPQYAGYTESTFDPRINDYAGSALSGGENIEYLDYVVVSNEFAKRNDNINTVKIPRTTVASLWKHWNLSDHFPVKAVIR
ncbi:sphingomyelin phosphodiesterase [Moritella sp. 28]|uniref:sphingomyelin phosphodiesterase n=1 Tax=Moritella sp. 28 TaxID=2746232 RepID=UPI00210610FE|nr:sphingomyelin phosphodiesterase [Moritella sp. 28]